MLGAFIINQMPKQMSILPMRKLQSATCNVQRATCSMQEAGIGSGTGNGCVCHQVAISAADS